MSIKKFILWGGIAGFLIIFYDYDFLVNAGGPNTPISDSIIKFLFPGQFICCWEEFKIASSVMIIAGAFVGLLVGLILKFLEKYD
jgi:hypothetical protein